MNGVFEGVNGAISLSLIAFSIVFMVLLGLTAVIYAVRFISSGIQGNKSNSQVKTKKAPAAPSTPAKAPTSGTSEEVVAAITGALIARIGKGFKIVSIKPRERASLEDSWTGWGRMEAMQGMDRSVWNKGSWN